MFRFSACSQKLLEWQENGEQRSEKIVLAKSIVREAKKPRSEKRERNASKHEVKTVTNSQENNHPPTTRNHRRRLNFS